MWRLNKYLDVWFAKCRSLLRRKYSTQPGKPFLLRFGHSGISFEALIVCGHFTSLVYRSVVQVYRIERETVRALILWVSKTYDASNLASWLGPKKCSMVRYCHIAGLLVIHDQWMILKFELTGSGVSALSPTQSSSDAFCKTTYILKNARS